MGRAENRIQAYAKSRRITSFSTKKRLPQEAPNRLACHLPTPQAKDASSSPSSGRHATRAFPPYPERCRFYLERIQGELRTAEKRGNYLTTLTRSHGQGYCFSINHPRARDRAAVGTAPTDVYPHRVKKAAFRFLNRLSQTIHAGEVLTIGIVF